MKHCKQCGDNFCVSCFAYLHRKGRLRRHTFEPLVAMCHDCGDRAQVFAPSCPRGSLLLNYFVHSWRFCVRLVLFIGRPSFVAVAVIICDVVVLLLLATGVSSSAVFLSRLHARSTTLSLLLALEHPIRKHHLRGRTPMWRVHHPQISCVLVVRFFFETGVQVLRVRAGRAAAPMQAVPGSSTR